MIFIEKLKVQYDEGGFIIDNLSLEIGKGESLAILGANGVGKTTLLHTLVGLLDIAGGEVIIDKLALRKENLFEIRQRVGLIFQSPDEQLFMPTVLDDIAFGLVNAKMSISDAGKKAKKILKEFKLESIKDVSPLRLSDGEKRLVAIAGVLVTNQKIILLDEPTAYLDYLSKKNLINIIKNLEQTKLVASHDINFCKEVCDRAIILKKGKIALDIPIAELENNKNFLEECGIGMPL
ncbi:MAG: energy-coupling factor ABC transporter ATP-binding protein [Clostridiales Family XIII bacterium]|jgi:cobalt/nickel transport system ATP-binding protein|nr:energy-coupling factor ABC transporter ATP-binding protein [Clostridiales Family XIII bacterium]